MRHLIIAFLATLFAAGLLTEGVTAGEVYKWTDKDGKVHYGDRPKHDAEPVAPKIGATASTPADPEAANKEAARAADCVRKKTQLDGYRKAPSIKETNGLGETREYSEAERQKLVAVTEQQVTAACAPASS